MPHALFQDAYSLTFQNLTQSKKALRLYYNSSCYNTNEAL